MEDPEAVGGWGAALEEEADGAAGRAAVLADDEVGGASMLCGRWSQRAVSLRRPQPHREPGWAAMASADRCPLLLVTRCWRAVGLPDQVRAHALSHNAQLTFGIDERVERREPRSQKRMPTFALDRLLMETALDGSQTEAETSPDTSKCSLLITVGTSSGLGESDLVPLGLRTASEERRSFFWDSLEIA